MCSSDLAYNLLILKEDDIVGFIICMREGSSYKSENNIRVNFMIKIDDDEVNLFDMQILDPYIDEEVARFIFEEEKWVLDNLIWPIDLCEEMK